MAFEAARCNGGSPISVIIDLRMGTPSRLIALIAMLCLLALHSTYAEAQGLKIEAVTKVAAADTGLIEGKVTDESGKPLDGANKYTITFEKGAAPPVNAFWSITLYDQEGFQVGNVLNRFAVSSWMPFKYNVDGSLDLYFQNASPGKELEANWLPAPKAPFNLTMRLYAPKSEALTGKWNPPPVVKSQTTVGISAQ